MIDEEETVANSSYVPANVSRNSWINVEKEVPPSMQSYLYCLDEEMSQQPGFKNLPVQTNHEKRTISITDPEIGYIHHGAKRGIGYLLEAAIDCKCGIITGTNTYSANEKESLVVLRHLENQILSSVFNKKVAFDRRYDT